MTNLQNKIVVVVGGSSGIGYAVALASLQSQASHVIVASRDRGRVNAAVERLKAHRLPGEVRGEVLDAKDSATVKAFAEGLGPVDHIVWTSGDIPEGANFLGISSAEHGKAAFTVRFWGPFILAQHAKINPGGSMTFTSGNRIASVKPHKGMTVWAGVTSALDGLVRGLAVDLAPIRVNLVNPGAINTEIFDKFSDDDKKAMAGGIGSEILLKRAGEPAEIAEAYTFLMKCGYITGQTILVEGGSLLV